MAHLPRQIDRARAARREPSPPPLAHFPCLLQTLRGAASGLRGHCTTSQRRGFKVKDALAAIVTASFSAFEVTLRRDGPEAALALLRDDDVVGLPQAIAEAVTGLDGERPLTAVEVAEGLLAVGIPANRGGVGEAVRTFAGEPCILLFEADGTWSARAGLADDPAAALAAEPPETIALVAFGPRGFGLAIRPRKLSQNVLERPLAEEPAGR